MSRAPLAKDCFDIDTAAHLLTVSSVQLYKELRGLDWLHSGKFSRDKAHNLPKDWARKAGYLTTQERGYPAPYNREIELTYRVSILTRHGLEAIAKHMNKTIDLPPAAPAALEIIEQLHPSEGKTTVNEEREKAIQDLKAMGLWMDKAS